MTNEESKKFAGIENKIDALIEICSILNSQNTLTHAYSEMVLDIFQQQSLESGLSVEEVRARFERLLAEKLIDVQQKNAQLLSSLEKPRPSENPPSSNN